MARIFQRGQLQMEAEEYRGFIDSFHSGELDKSDIEALNRDLIAAYGHDGLKRIKVRAWKLIKEGR